MIADIYIDVEQHLNAALSQGPLKETKNDTGEIPDYGATGVTGMLRSKCFHLE
jgi:hypothetical protein